MPYALDLVFQIEVIAAVRLEAAPIFDIFCKAQPIGERHISRPRFPVRLPLCGSYAAGICPIANELIDSFFTVVIHVITPLFILVLTVATAAALPPLSPP